MPDSMTMSEDIAVGTALPAFEKTFRPVDLMAYGAATWDWARVHYDLPYAKTLAFPNVFVDGQNWGAIFAKQAMDWAGPRGFVVKMSLRFKTMVFAGDSVALVGSVADIRTDAPFRIITLDQRITKGDQLVATCITEARLPT